MNPRDPRARLVTAADGELRRIERALHDGVQQDLIAVSVRLQLARRLADTDFPAAIALLDEVGRDVRTALDRVRSLANEIYPSMLEARGLPDALRGAASASGAATTVEAVGIGRYPAEVEAAVYFACRAALEAVAAHRLGVTRVAITIVDEKDTLRLVVGAEGVAAPGAADRIRSARDRIEAFGGLLSFESAAGTTRLTATVPLA